MKHAGYITIDDYPHSNPFSASHMCMYVYQVAQAQLLLPIYKFFLSAMNLS